jgi:stress response protein YsnF
MQRILSKLPQWDLDRKDEDIRGWPLRDAEGRTLGTVSELVADTDTRCITQVVLGDGRRIRAHDLLIGDHMLTLASAAPRAETKPREAAAKMPAAGAAAAAGAAIRGNGNGDAKVRDLAARRAKAAPAAMPAGDDVIIALVDEEIEIGKRKIDGGGVRIEMHTVSKPFREEVRLREEHVSVERRRVDEPISVADADAQLRDRAVEMTATSELPVIAKRAHAIEEIVLKKERTERVERVEDTVRHTDVEVVEIPVKNRPKA